MSQTELTGRQNPLPAIPSKVLFEGLHVAQVAITLDTQLAAGTGALALMPPDLFEASEVSGHLRVKSLEGFTGGSVTLRIGPQRAEDIPPQVSVGTTVAPVSIKGDHETSLRVDTLDVVTTGIGAISVSNVAATRNIRLFADRADKVVTHNVTAGGTILTPPK